MVGGLPLLKPAWTIMRRFWWVFMVVHLKVEGMRGLGWKLLPQITPMEWLVMRRFMLPEKRQPLEMVIWIEWSLKVETKALLPTDISPFHRAFYHHEYYSLEL